jgi:hypothetical protein
MPDLTDEEYDALDEYWTKHTPKLSGDGKSGFFARHAWHIVFVDDFSATWLRLKSEATNKTVTEIIGELVREKAAVRV